MTLTALLADKQARRNRLYRSMEEVLNGVEADKRQLSAAEEGRYKALETEYESVTFSPEERIALAQDEISTRATAMRVVNNEGIPVADPSGVLTRSDKMSQRPSGLSLGKTVRAAILGDTRGADAEVRALGIVSGGSTLITGELYNEIMDVARANAVAIKAGALQLPMHTHQLIVPKLLTDVSVTWRAENASVLEGDPSFGAVVLTAKSLSGIVKVSRELLQDAPLAETAIRNSVAHAIALALDAAMMWGSGVDPVPMGIYNTTGVVKVDQGTNGASLTNYDPIISAVAAIRGQNREPNAYVLNPRDAAALSKLKNTLGDYLEPPAVVTNLEQYTTTAESIAETHGTASNASSIVVGQFNQAAFGIREGINIMPLYERYSDNGQVAFWVNVRADCAVLDTRAFAVVTGIIP